MTIHLDHTIIPSNDKDEGARFVARILGLHYDGAGYFAPVRVNERLTLDFADGGGAVDSLHYAFVVDDHEFDAILARILDEKLEFGSGPRSADDGEINHRRGGRGLYFTGGPDPHLWEIMTVPETGS